MATLAGRFVQVVIRGSDLNRGRQIAKAEFEQLAPADTGAVEYYKKLPDGGQLQCPRQVYFDRLAEEKRRRHPLLYPRAPALSRAQCLGRRG